MAFVQQILFNIIYFIWINTYNRENRSSFLFFYSNYDISTRKLQNSESMKLYASSNE